MEHSPNVLDLLNMIFNFEMDAEEKKRIMQEDFDIEMTKELDEEVSTMSSLGKQLEESGIAKGMQMATIMYIRNIMDSLNMTAEQAMSIMKVPEDEQLKYKELVEQAI